MLLLLLKFLSIHTYNNIKPAEEIWYYTMHIWRCCHNNFFPSKRTKEGIEAGGTQQKLRIWNRKTQKLSVFSTKTNHRIWSWIPNFIFRNMTWVQTYSNNFKPVRLCFEKMKKNSGGNVLMVVSWTRRNEEPIPCRNSVSALD